MRYPTEEEAVEILRKYRLPKEIVEHSKRVAGIGVKIAKQIKKAGHDVDVEAVRAAALLHDLGKWKYLHNKKEIGHMHSCETGRLLAELGWPELGAVCGAHFGVTAKEAKQFGLPNPHNMMPDSIEAKVLYIADKIRPDSRNLKQIIEVINNSKKLELRYWNLCPGFKEKIIKDVTRIWYELEKLGMKV